MHLGSVSVLKVKDITSYKRICDILGGEMRMEMRSANEMKWTWKEEKIGGP